MFGGRTLLGVAIGIVLYEIYHRRMAGGAQ